MDFDLDFANHLNDLRKAYDDLWEAYDHEQQIVRYLGRQWALEIAGLRGKDPYGDPETEQAFASAADQVDEAIKGFQAKKGWR